MLLFKLINYQHLFLGYNKRNTIVKVIIKKIVKYMKKIKIVLNKIEYTISHSDSFF